MAARKALRRRRRRGRALVDLVVLPKDPVHQKLEDIVVLVEQKRAPEHHQVQDLVVSAERKRDPKRRVYLDLAAAAAGLEIHPDQVVALAASVEQRRAPECRAAVEVEEDSVASAVQRKDLARRPLDNQTILQRARKRASLDSAAVADQKEQARHRLVVLQMEAHRHSDRLEVADLAVPKGAVADLAELQMEVLHPLGHSEALKEAVAD